MVVWVKETLAGRCGTAMHNKQCVHGELLTIHLRFNSRFPGEPGLCGNLRFSPYTYSGRELLDEWHGSDVLTVKALKETQGTDPSQWPGLILSSSTTGLLRERELFPSCHLSNTSISIYGELQC